MRPSVIADGPAERLLREGLRRGLAERGHAEVELDSEVEALLRRPIDIDLEPEFVLQGQDAPQHRR
jgi:hypothetical protein